MSTSHDSSKLEAQTVETGGLHQIYSHLLDLILFGVSQLPGEGFTSVRYARTVKINKPMRLPLRGTMKVRVL